MFAQLKLDRPLAVFDIESTGIAPRADRIIEISAIRIAPNHSETTRHWLLNPTIPIPIESTAIHGITDAMVSSCPTFEDAADDIERFFANCDLAGYNIVRFDVPILAEEFARIGRDFNQDSRRMLDAQRIFHYHEPRDLAAALKFFCGREHEDAHSADADARATLDVIKGEFEKYDLPLNMDELDHKYNATDPFNVDRSGRIRWVNGEMTINFGKKKGAKISDLLRDDRPFLQWMLRNAFPLDTRRIIQNALDGIFPTPPLVRKVRGE